jgi:5-methyltetrahydropteroyltriglutamate--homocysteine methyltransferase
MSIQQNTDRILTTHVGSLPRPHALLDLMKARAAGGLYERASGDRYDQQVRTAVADCVRKQAESGIDILTDGEQSKLGFFTYVRERLTGFEERPDLPTGAKFEAEVSAFPEYYEQYFKHAMLGGSVVPTIPLVCTGPVTYRGDAAIRRDIANLKTAVAEVQHHAAFMPAVAPSGVGMNEYYKTEEEFFHAVGAALRTEYQAIVDAGFLLQIDDPFLSENFADPHLNPAQRHARATIYVESVNESLRGIPFERVRFHTCYGINEGPRIHEAALAEVVGYMLKVNAGAYSFESANPRHEHEYHLWETVKLPEGKVLIPGVITHASNIVEHPELIAERILRFAKLVGRENILAGADCGFSSQATYSTEVHPTVIWAKFEALRDGARLASKQLWA